MKILVAGSWRLSIYEEAIHRALEELGHDTHKFGWSGWFQPASPNGIAGKLDAVIKRAQFKYLTGPVVARLNRELVRAVGEIQPDVVFLFRGVHVFPATLRAIKRIHPGAMLAGYNTDDPFSRQHPRWLWRHFRKGLGEYDLMLSFRRRDAEAYRRHHVPRTGVLSGWYLPWLHQPVNLTPEEIERFGCDLVFVGHYEPDGRLELLRSAVRAGFRVRLFGQHHGWRKPLQRSPELRHLWPVAPLWGEDYTRAIAGAKVALCCLSRRNGDTYTSRTFEIPAIGTMMLAEHTDDHATLFKEGEEAEFFRTPEEFLEKLDHYIRNDALRQRVAAAGRSRVIADRHDVVSRISDMLDRFDMRGTPAAPAS